MGRRFADIQGDRIIAMNGENVGRDAAIDRFNEINQSINQFTQFDKQLGKYINRITFTVKRQSFDDTWIYVHVSCLNNINNILNSLGSGSFTQNDSYNYNHTHYKQQEKNKFFAPWTGKYSYNYTNLNTDCPVFIQDREEIISGIAIVELINESALKKKTPFNFDQEQLKSKIEKVRDEYEW